MLKPSKSTVPRNVRSHQGIDPRLLKTRAISDPLELFGAESTLKIYSFEKRTGQIPGLESNISKLLISVISVAI